MFEKNSFNNSEREIKRYLFNKSLRKKKKVKKIVIKIKKKR